LIHRFLPLSLSDFPVYRRKTDEYSFLQQTPGQLFRFWPIFTGLSYKNRINPVFYTFFLFKLFKKFCFSLEEQKKGDLPSLPL